MTDEIQSLLEHLNALGNELREFRSEFPSESESLKSRMSALGHAATWLK